MGCVRDLRDLSGPSGPSIKVNTASIVVYKGKKYVFLKILRGSWRNNMVNAMRLGYTHKSVAGVLEQTGKCLIYNLTVQIKKVCLSYFDIVKISNFELVTFRSDEHLIVHFG